MSHEPLRKSNNHTFRAVFKDPLTNLAINIASATPTFRFKMGTGAAVDRTPLTTPAVTITDGPNGKAEYKMATAELTVGELSYEWEITDGGGNLFGQNRLPFKRLVIDKLA